jgi:hypothetical protein
VTREADEPEVQQQPPIAPPPEQPSPFQRIIDKFQMELGRLSGQLLVERAQWEMEREQYVEQIANLRKELEDAGVVPKSGGGQPGDAPSGGAPVTPLREASRPRPAKKSAPAKRR